ncbi:protein of unknown function DUF421 [Paenibacillus curdlanolyticus YK9]|uniref:YetF C-terminal domain-containing protein n=1 Tax=Paenibacillus curdlanolyticus YK9 TaxID=717606 RepID=E0IDX9_9BACL|nr:DUF421 domain-containing protein [Paenibacillus curdlanolyticus]EFM09333.1 protein of unknown function DUF421 [Paenibacillus curdlanolyticus YK9]
METGELGSLLIRTILIYFVVFLVMRLMGKREIGKMSVLDLVISFMIAEIAVIVIEDTSRSMWHGVVPMVLLMLIQIMISFVAMKNRKIRLLFDGKPSIIVENGKINRGVMTKGRYNLDDLMLQLRENGVSTVGDVEFAILETSGKLSVIKREREDSGMERGYRSSTAHEDTDKGEAGQQAAEQKERNHVSALNPAASSTSGSSLFPNRYRFEMLPVPLIMDGKVQDENLEKLEKTRFWLKNELQQRGVSDFKEVFLCTVDHRGKWYVDKSRTRK